MVCITYYCNLRVFLLLFCLLHTHSIIFGILAFTAESDSRALLSIHPLPSPVLAVPHPFFAHQSSSYLRFLPTNHIPFSLSLFPFLDTQINPFPSLFLHLPRDSRDYSEKDSRETLLCFPVHILISLSIFVPFPNSWVPLPLPSPLILARSPFLTSKRRRRISLPLLSIVCSTSPSTPTFSTRSTTSPYVPRPAPPWSRSSTSMRPSCTRITPISSRPTSPTPLVTPSAPSSRIRPTIAAMSLEPRRRPPKMLLWTLVSSSAEDRPPEATTSSAVSSTTSSRSTRSPSSTGTFRPLLLIV